VDQNAKRFWNESFVLGYKACPHVPNERIIANAFSVRFPDSYLINCVHRAAYRLPFIFAIKPSIIRSSAFADAEMRRSRKITQKFSGLKDFFSKR